MKNTYITRFLSEFFGTFLLTGVVIAASLSNMPGIFVALFAGVTLSILVYTLGKFSGAHVNPAVTIGALSVQKITPVQALVHVVGQFLGSAVASLAAVSAGSAATGLTLSKLFAPLASGTWAFSGGAFIAELVGTFVFAFGIASISSTHGDNSPKPTGFVIGFSLFIGAAIAAALGSNGILNPAIAFGIANFNPAYVLGPIVGAVLGMWAYVGLSNLQKMESTSKVEEPTA